VEGDYTLGNSNGRITVENVRGAFDIRTSNGSIEFDGEPLPGGQQSQDFQRLGQHKSAWASQREPGRIDVQRFGSQQDSDDHNFI
jgi:hypothetical protein